MTRSIIATICVFTIFIALVSLVTIGAAGASCLHCADPEDRVYSVDPNERRSVASVRILEGALVLVGDATPEVYVRVVNPGSEDRNFTLTLSGSASTHAVNHHYSPGEAQVQIYLRPGEVKDVAVPLAVAQVGQEGRGELTVSATYLVTGSDYRPRATSRGAPLIVFSPTVTEAAVALAVLPEYPTLAEVAICGKLAEAMAPKDYGQLQDAGTCVAGISTLRLAYAISDWRSPNLLAWYMFIGAVVGGIGAVLLVAVRRGSAKTPLR